MSLIDYLNELIDYSMGFPFYQRLNPLFNGISNEDAPLSSGRSILARPTQGPRTLFYQKMILCVIFLLLNVTSCFLFNIFVYFYF